MVTQLREGVWWLDLTGVNAYLLADEDGATLIDAGTPLDASAIEAAIDAAGFTMADVERVLITHYDVDHVGGLGRLPLDAPVYVGSPDAALLTGARSPPIATHKGFVQWVSGPFVKAIPDQRVRPVEDGETVGGFRAIHTPGHTAGHTVYVHEDRSAAFLGDLVVARNGEIEPSPWLLSADTDAVAASIRDVAGRIGDIAVAAMGHGTPFERGGGDRLRELAASL